MARKAWLALHGRQRGESGEETVIESRLEADYYEKNGSHYILYEEKSQEDGTVTKNTIKLKGSVLEMTRRGSVHTHMVFQAGEKHAADYITLYGSLQIETDTESLDISLKDGRMDVRLKYGLTCGGQLLSHCSLTISLRPLPDSSQ